MRYYVGYCEKNEQKIQISSLCKNQSKTKKLIKKQQKAKIKQDFSYFSTVVINLEFLIFLLER